MRVCVRKRDYHHATRTYCAHNAKLAKLRFWRLFAIILNANFLSHQNSIEPHFQTVGEGDTRPLKFVLIFFPFNFDLIVRNT